MSCSWFALVMVIPKFTFTVSSAIRIMAVAATRLLFYFLSCSITCGQIASYQHVEMYPIIHCIFVSLHWCNVSAPDEYVNTNDNARNYSAFAESLC